MAKHDASIYFSNCFDLLYVIPYFFITGAKPVNLLPSSSRFIEFIMGLPGICRTAARMTAGSV